MPTMQDIFGQSRDIKNRIFNLKTEIEIDKERLSKLQKACPHPTKHRRLEFEKDPKATSCEFCLEDWINPQS